ncbi:MAG: N-acetylgalactosamine-6-sulfatase [Acidobacteria bacterium]|nr:N-acetylgalactosamine-6-sulfatase [Acidobacteriota bacterium]
MTRRTFLASSAVAAAVADRPHIILCMGDDHGWNETGYNGHKYAKTPVLDEMAARGLRLDRFYSAHPNCSPTRGSIMTGRHPNRYGTFAPGWSIRPEEITIAQLLRGAGYATGHFGKWHLGPVKKESPVCPGAMGFDEWLSHDNFYEIDPWLARNGAAPEQIKGESSEIVVREALRFIGAAKRPTFTVIWFGSPHAPYVAREPELSMYWDLQEPIRSRMAEITALDTAMGQLRAGLTKLGIRDNTLLWYCGDNGVPQDGIVDIPFRGAKGQVYEGGVRIPGLIEWPSRIRKGRATPVDAVTSDILPTLCDLTGVAPPKRPLDGISLRPLIEGRMNARPKPIFFWEFSFNRPAVRSLKPYIDPPLQVGTTPTATQRDGKLTRDFLNYRFEAVSDADLAGPAAMVGPRHKLVVDGAVRRNQQGSTRELFALATDRREASDLSGSNGAQVEAMEKSLREWQRSVLRSLTGADYTSAR